jgi:hypothetical protein
MCAHDPLAVSIGVALHCSETCRTHRDRMVTDSAVFDPTSAEKLFSATLRTSEKRWQFPNYSPKKGPDGVKYFLFFAFLFHAIDC